MFSIIEEEIGKEEFEKKSFFEKKKILDDIEKEKNKLTYENTDKIPIKLPFKNAIWWRYEHVGKKEKIKYNKEFINFPSDLMIKIITEMIEKLKNDIKSAINNKNIKYIILAGEFSKSKILQELLKKEFGKNIIFYKKKSLLKPKNSK